MPYKIEIIPIKQLPAGLASLANEARHESFLFLDRLVEDWESGANRFSRRGEVLYGAFDEDLLVAIGGLNCDPWLQDETVGRLRRVFVSGAYRRKGTGRKIVRALLAEAELIFSKVRLRTNDQDASNFYLSCGFHRVDGESVTHEIELSQVPVPE